MKVNEEVSTPLGDGIVEGMNSYGKVIVRLPVNDVTRPHLIEAYGTKRANISGLWPFDETDIKEKNQSVQQTKNIIHKERKPRKEVVAKPEKLEGFTQMTRRLYAEGMPMEDICTFMVDHEKFKGNPGKARAYAIAVVKYIQKQKREGKE